MSSSCGYEVFQVARFGIFSSAGRSLQNHRGAQIGSGVSQCLYDFHIIDIKGPNSVVAFIGLFEHFCSSY